MSNATAAPAAAASPEELHARLLGYFSHVEACGRGMWRVHGPMVGATELPECISAAGRWSQDMASGVVKYAASAPVAPLFDASAASEDVRADAHDGSASLAETMEPFSVVVAAALQPDEDGAASLSSRCMSRLRELFAPESCRMRRSQLRRDVYGALCRSFSAAGNMELYVEAECRAQSAALSTAAPGADVVAACQRRVDACHGMSWWELASSRMLSHEYGKAPPLLGGLCGGLFSATEALARIKGCELVRIVAPVLLREEASKALARAPQQHHAGSVDETVAAVVDITQRRHASNAERRRRALESLLSPSRHAGDAAAFYASEKEASVAAAAATAAAGGAGELPGTYAPGDVADIEDLFGGGNAALSVMPPCMMKIHAAHEHPKHWQRMAYTAGIADAGAHTLEQATHFMASRWEFPGGGVAAAAASFSSLYSQKRMRCGSDDGEKRYLYNCDAIIQPRAGSSRAGMQDIACPYKEANPSWDAFACRVACSRDAGVPRRVKVHGNVSGFVRRRRLVLGR